MAKYSLCKAERLSGKLAISNLFDNGQSFFLTPYKVCWTTIPETYHFPIRFAVSVPKRRFKKAVKRNQIKRLTREIFRTNKEILTPTLAQGQTHVMLIYVCDVLLPYAELEKSMRKILQRINLSTNKLVNSG